MEASRSVGALWGFGIRRPTDEINKEILADQVGAARRQYLVIGAAAAIGTIVVVITFVDLVPLYILLPWAIVAAATSVSSIRSGIRQRRQGDRKPKDAFRAARKILWRSWIAAAFWGATYLVGASVAHEANQDVLTAAEWVALLFASGTAAGLISGLGTLPLLWAPMSFLILFPVAIASSLSSHEEGTLIAVVLGLFVAALFLTGANAHNNYVRNAHLRNRAARLTVQKTEVEEELERFFDRTNTLIAMISVGDGGMFVRVNPMWERILGYAPSEMVGRRSREFIHPDDADAAREAHLGTQAGEDVSGLLLRYRHKDGAYRWLQWNVTYDPGTKHAFCTAADVTAREQSRVMKKQLVSTVSHELRTPLTALKASLGLLSAGLAPDSKTRDQLIDIADRNADRLTSLTDDFLDLEGQGRSRKLDIVPCKLIEIVNAAVTDLQPVFEPVGIVCLVNDETGGAEALGDRERVGQVVTNLLSNAFKFAPVNSHVRIVLRARDGMARVSISDEGIGLPEGTSSTVFERFVQVNTPQRRVGGTGLGLAISKDLIDAMKGRIGVESEPGNGATFFFELPLAEAAGPVSVTKTA